jgi:hypothetical protein
MDPKFLLQQENGGPRGAASWRKTVLACAATGRHGARGEALVGADMGGTLSTGGAGGAFQKQ